MDNNYFLLELDTTSPMLEIISPVYTQQDIVTDIYIYSSEKLMVYQDIYIIDSKGIRYDVTMSYFETYYYGRIQMSGYSSGIATIYCRLKDEVGNLSELVSKTINILKGENLILDSFVETMKINSNFYPMLVDIKHKEAEIHETHESATIIVKEIAGGEI